MVFCMQEYKERIRNIKLKMQENGIDVLFVTNPSNMNYLTGYNAWSFYVQQMVLVMIDEEEPVWIGRKMDANSAKVTTWLSEHNIISYTDDYIQSELKHPMDFVADVLKEKRKSRCSIGLEMETHFFSAKCYQKVIQNLPNATFVDASVMVNWVRLVKSNQEITYMKRAAKIAEKAMRKGFNTIGVGVRECDVAGEIMRTQAQGTHKYGGDYTAIVPMLPSGVKTSSPHITWSDETYKYGDPVILELAGCHNRYHSPLARTMVLGEPSSKLKELSNVVIEGLNTTIQAIKPGMTGEEIETVWRTSISKKGYEKDSRIGYSVGLSYPPDWGEHTVSIRKGERTVMQENMCLHLIPGIWYDDVGFEMSETIRITEKGCETLADFPRELYIKEF